MGDVDPSIFPTIFPEADRRLAPPFTFRRLPHQRLLLILYNTYTTTLSHHSKSIETPDNNTFNSTTTKSVKMVKAGKRCLSPSPPVLQVHGDLSKFERDGAPNPPVTPFQPLHLPEDITYIYPPQAPHQTLYTITSRPLPPP